MGTTFLRALAGAALLAVASGPALAATEIQWWHAMGGELGEKLNAIAKGYNQSQTAYTVVPVYKGSYAETLTAAIAAFRAKQQPAIVQVFEVGTATMMAAKGAVYPVFQLMKDTGEAFDPASYLPAVTGYYSDVHGNMLSLPFNSSTPVLYYNKDAFQKAGLDPEAPPTTWPELEADAKKLQTAGTTCGFTTGWPSWVQIENFSAWHNLPIGTLSNGFGGLATRLTINNELVVRHIGQLAEWQKSKIFDYGGRESASAPKFYSGECAIYMNSSAAYSAIRANVKSFKFGVGMLPYWPDVKGAPQNSIIGGATLWVLSGLAPEVYKGVAGFFSYLSSPPVQADWHQFSGYLPITMAAYELTRQQGFYDKNPGTDVAIKQMTLHAPTENSKGLRFGYFVQIRNVIEEDLEAILSGKMTAKAGLDDAVARGNELLARFETENGGKE
ncbi:MAG TPA: sn-glycerol-3-phosphate ABC transporter substrate-binding protein UgpB [Alphaproteobacteria bacterium]|nr:sn-glycerol-3-phosphate ABC transporter substrate-binding protein UgpB [Alphaproteobacteria bacterium]